MKYFIIAALLFGAPAAKAETYSINTTLHLCGKYVGSWADEDLQRAFRDSVTVNCVVAGDSAVCRVSAGDGTRTFSGSSVNDTGSGLVVETYDGSGLTLQVVMTYGHRVVGFRVFSPSKKSGVQCVVEQ